ncbi:MAG: YkgJ family cysteine cluster protein [Candidatus Kariarchaeaceae archaeon]
MTVELPVIQPGQVIGEINLLTGSVTPNTSFPMKFTCTSRVDCCSRLSIPVTEPEIDRIVKAGYELDQIIRDSSPVILNPSSNVGRQQKAYILKKKPFDGTCTFLEEKMCSIHEIKPIACRLYPFSLNIMSEEQIEVIVHEGQVCQSILPADDVNSNSFHLESIRDLLSQELEKRQ